MKLQPGLSLLPRDTYSGHCCQLGIEVTLAVAAGSSGLVQTDLPWNAFREMLNKSCFQLSGNSWILVLRGSIEQAQVERNDLFQWADYGTRN